MEYPEKSIGGSWLDTKAIPSGSKVKIVGETVMRDSQFENPKTGEPKTENITKVQYENQVGNMRLNWTTIWGLRDAFGKESKEWIGKEATLHKTRAMVGDKMRDIIHLIPTGFELGETEEGKLEIRKIGAMDERDEFPADEEPVIE